MFYLVLLLTMFSTTAFSAHHFSEMSFDGSVWRVDHFKVEEGKLQDFVETRTFTEKSKAQNFVTKITTLNKKSFSHAKFVSQEAQSIPLWEVKNQWSEEWEIKYSEWIKNNFDKYFFEKYQVMTDCADVAYALRWIFARNNNLPAAATLAGSGVIVSQESTKAEWNTLETHEEWHKDKRFLAALDWLLNSVYTKTLNKDAYPVKITKDTIRPGLINLMGSHTEILASVSSQPDEIPLLVLSSTVPKAVRVLSSRPYLDSRVPDPADGGLLRFRWPELQGQTWNMIAKEKMNQYSLEQYKTELCPNEPRISFCIMKKLGLTFKSDLLIKKIIQGLEESIAQRKEIIRDGLAYCASNPCAPGTQGWEDWGTPSRDKRLGDSLKSAVNLADDIEQTRYFSNWYKKTNIDVDLPITIEKFTTRLVAGLASYDPRDSVEARWAANPTAILSGLNQRVVEYKKERGIQIEKASVCRADPTICQKSREVLIENSTLVMDTKMLNILKAWDVICREEPCPESFSGNNLLYKMWFQSPIPWHSVQMRQGIQPPADAHILYTEVVQDGGENYIILDKRKLYNLESRKEVVIPGGYSALSYDKESDLLIASNRKEIAFLDQQLHVRGKIAFPSQFYKLVAINMGGGELIVTPDMPLSGTVGPVPVWIVNTKTMTIREFGQYSCIMKVVDGKKTYLVMSGEKSLVLSSSAQGIMQAQMAALPKFFNDAIHLRNNDFLITRYDFDLGKHVVLHLTQNSLKLIRSSKSMNWVNINSNFFFIADYDRGDNAIMLFDKDLNQHLGNEVLRPGLPLNDETQLYLSQTSSNKWQVYRIGKELTLLNPKLKEDEFIFAANEQNFTYASEIGFVTKDYDGNFLSQHPFILRGNCSGFITSNCFDPKNKMWIEQYFIDDVGYRQLGKSGSSTPMIFLIGGASDRGWGPFGSNNPKNDIGHQIDLGDGYLMWFKE